MAAPAQYLPQQTSAGWSGVRHTPPVEEITAHHRRKHKRALKIAHHRNMVQYCSLVKRARIPRSHRVLPVFNLPTSWSPIQTGNQPPMGLALQSSPIVHTEPTVP
jgi:hypothetical protein